MNSADGALWRMSTWFNRGLASIHYVKSSQVLRNFTPV